MKTKQRAAQYLINESGDKAFAVLPVDEYEELLEDLHDLAVLAERRDEPRVAFNEFEEMLKTNASVSNRS